MIGINIHTNEDIATMPDTKKTIIWIVLHVCIKYQRAT